MTAVGEVIQHVPPVGIVQQIIQHDNSRFMTRLFEIGVASAVDDPFSGTCQLLTSYGRVLAEAPHNIAEIGHCTVRLDR